MLFFVTLLAPEWVLTWALRQFLRARKLVKELEDARKEAESGWEKGEEEEEEMSDSEDKDHGTIASTSEFESDEQVLIKRRGTSPGKDSQRESH